MKNLFKTLITVITVVCMLASMTAFAASQTTVTKYGSDTNVNVVTTVSGVAADAIVTYLVAKDANSNGVADAEEIKYINQATSDGNKAIEFTYSITGEGWTAGNVIADVKFGSNDAEVASDLKKVPESVLFDDIEFVVNVPNSAEISYEKIGKGDVYKDVKINALPGYTVKSVKIGGDVVTDTTTNTYTVAYGETVEVEVEAITDTTVYLFTDATVTDGFEVYDAKKNEKLSVVTGIGYYVGGPVDSAEIKFEGCNIDGEHPDFKYVAADVDKGAKSGYFAVQLASANAADLKPATEACVVVNGQHIPSKNDTVVR